MAKEVFWVESFQENGDEGFIVEFYLNGESRYILSDYPQMTNMGNRRILEGWVGTTDNTARFAHGVGRVVKIAKNGRAKVRKLTNPEQLEGALEDLGFAGLLEM